MDPMTFLSHASALGHKSADAARRSASAFLRDMQPRLFDAIYYCMTLPRRIHYAFRDHVARKMAAEAGAPVMAPVSAPANDTGFREDAAQSRPVQTAAQPPVIITREARGLMALSRENPKLAIIIVCMVMGAIQMGLFALIIFMLHDSGYSSGWGDATKYFFQCQSRSVL
jgi:hypothetical protein